MSQQINQISLVSAILKELDRQGKDQTPPIIAAVSTRQFNVICDAATTICQSMATDDIPSKPNEGLQCWLGGHDTGVSSLTMAAVMFNAGNYVGNPHRFSHPHDSDDFGRCHRFLEAVPGSRDLLHLMDTVSPVWKALVQQWPEITTLYLEGPQKAHPRIRAIIDQVERRQQ